MEVVAGADHAYAVVAFVAVLVFVVVEVEHHPFVVDLVVEVAHHPFAVDPVVEEVVLDLVPIVVEVVAIVHWVDKDCNIVDLRKKTN